MKTPKNTRGEKGSVCYVDPKRGETMEQKTRRITVNKEPITDTATPLYSERGYVIPATDIRTDKWEVAREAKDKVSKAISESYQKKAEPKAEPKEEPKTE